MRGRTIISAVAVVMVAGSCSESRDVRPRADAAPTTSSSSTSLADEGSSATSQATSGVDGGSSTNTIAAEVGGELPITVDVGLELGPISPLIRGLSGGVDHNVLRDLGATVNSWGGNPASRFNYELGHAWNAGADWEYRNGNYGQSGDAARDFIVESEAGGAMVRLAVPTLGWIAKDDNNDTCSFPTADGCTGGDGLSCDNPGSVADPTLANVPSTPEMVGDWIERLLGDGATVPFVAMDNEPELWGHTHYDIHPGCTTYEEVLERYLSYADAVQAAAPGARLMGPVTCCWFDYWRTAPGPADGQDVDYLTWFLEQVRRHDERVGARSLHLLDVHYYPQSDVYNDETDAETAARRLRSTRSLWDPTYVDESWIGTPIQFVRRMRDTIVAAYPGTGLAISEWNFGADTTMNGALAIADVLGIYGREGVELAAYWQHPPLGSPGAFAFKMHGNYDGQGSAFTGVALDITTPDVDALGAFAALDRDAGRLRILLINKSPDEDLAVPVSIAGTTLGPGKAALYRYSEAAAGEIVREEMQLEPDGLQVELPAYSITLVEVPLTS